MYRISASIHILFSVFLDYFTTPWLFRPKGYCRCLHLSVCPSIHPFVCRWTLFCQHKNRFQLQSSNLHQTCIILLKRGSLTLIFRVILVNLTQNSRNSACLHDNSSRIWAGITKFAPYMHPRILWDCIENGGHWPWPTRSFWNSKKQHSSFFYTDLGRSRGVSRPKCALVLHVIK